jgi:diguanylate cyclase (GGDEF)-like protein
MQTQEKFSILLVDDDRTVIRILNHILSAFTPVRFATSGRAALKLARESTPDLVLLDVDLPELSGFEVCKAFKSDPLLKDVPIIFITSHESLQLESKGLELGAADFIQKPPHPPLVLARVRTYQRLKTLSDTLRSAVTMDFLTGAVARRQFEKALTQEWLRAERTAAPLSLLLADIDGFADYDAECGEDKGEACLKSVADALRSAAHRHTDLLGRWAGGRFALLLPETDARGAVTVAQRAIEGVYDLAIPHTTGMAGEGRITLSVGGGCRESSRSISRGAFTDNAAPTRLSGRVPDDLTASAERALESARSGGGHQAKFLDVADADHDVAAAHHPARAGRPAA